MQKKQGLSSLVSCDYAHTFILRLLCYDEDMKITTALRYLFETLLYYKIFSVPLALLLFILLIRVPLGTFSQASALDPIAHFILPALSGVLLFAVLVRSKFLPPTAQAGSVFMVIILGVFVEVLWEIFEYIVDLTLHLGWQLGNSDTMADLILAVIGSAIGGLVLVKHYPPVAPKTLRD